MSRFVQICLGGIVVLICFGYSSCLAQQADAIEKYSEEGRRALQAGHFAEAEQSFEQLRKLEPGAAEVYVALGLIYYQQGKYDQAIPTLTRALKLKPNAPKVEALLSMSQSEMGRFTEAVPGLEKCFHQPPDPEVRRMCGLQLERADSSLQRDTKAVEVAMEMDRLYPNDPEVLYHSGRIYGNLAFVTVQRLAEVAPNSIWKQQAAAEAYESQGDLQAAIDAYHAVLAIDPQRPGIHYRVGRSLLTKARQSNSPADLTAALQEFEAELSINPSNGNAAYEIAEIHRTAGELDQAATGFEQVLKLYPEFGEAQLGLAAVLMAQQKPDQALTHLKQAIALDPSNEVAWYRLSRAESMLGDQAEQSKAIAEFRRLKELRSKQNEAAKVAVPTEEITRQRVDANP